MHIRGFMNLLAEQVHAHAGPDRRDIPGSQNPDHFRQGIQNFLLRHRDLGMIAADVFGDFSCILQVDRINIHADRKGSDRLAAGFLRNCADQRAVKTAGEQEPDRGIRIQTLQNPIRELVMNLLACGLQIIGRSLFRMPDGRIRNESAIFIIRSRRECMNVMRNRHQTCRRAAEADLSVLGIAVEHRPDSDRIATRDEGVLLRVIDDHGIFAVQMIEHASSVFLIKRKNDLTVAVRTEGVSFRFQFFPDWSESVQLAIAYDIRTIFLKWLHSGFIQSHDGKPLESENAFSFQNYDPAHIRAAVLQFCQSFFKCVLIRFRIGCYQYSAHI